MSKHASRSVRRAPVLIAVAGTLIVGGLIDRIGAPRVAPTVTAEAVQPVPVAAPAGAYSSSWFCAGATNGGPGYAAGEVVLANDGTRPVTGRVSVVSTPAPPAAHPSAPARPSAPASASSTTTSSTVAAPTVRTVTVAPHSTATVPESVAGGGPWAGAVVDVDGGSVAVSQVVDGPLGGSASPCATSGSQHWYLPTGQTRVNASETVLLLNPYPTHSIVDLSFTTDQGVETPQEFQSLDVPPGGLLAVPLGTHLRRRASIATTVSARNGNVVAWEAEVVTPPAPGAAVLGTPAAGKPLADPAWPVAGVTVTLGAPSAGTTWVWPDGLAGDGIDEQYVIYNPGSQTAQVSVGVGLEHGSAEPFPITVGPYQAVSLVSEQQARIPAGMPHTATLVSTNGVPVVAARTVSALAARVPGSGVRTGTGQMLGERIPALAWIAPATLADQGRPAQVVIENPGTVAVRASVQALGLPFGGTLSVPPGGRVAAAIHPGVGALVVSASGPVYVETDAFGVSGAPGYSIATAVPLS